MRVFWLNVAEYMVEFRIVAHEHFVQVQSLPATPVAPRQASPLLPQPPTGYSNLPSLYNSLAIL